MVDQSGQENGGGGVMKDIYMSDWLAGNIIGITFCDFILEAK